MTQEWVHVVDSQCCLKKLFHIVKHKGVPYAVNNVAVLLFHSKVGRFYRLGWPDLGQHHRSSSASIFQFLQFRFMDGRENEAINSTFPNSCFSIFEVIDASKSITSKYSLRLGSPCSGCNWQSRFRSESYLREQSDFVAFIDVGRSIQDFTNLAAFSFKFGSPGDDTVMWGTVNDLSKLRYRVPSRCVINCPRRPLSVKLVFPMVGCVWTASSNCNATSCRNNTK